MKQFFSTVVVLGVILSASFSPAENKSSRDVIMKRVQENDLSWGGQEIVFYKEGKEIARESTDNYQNVIRASGTVPDGWAKELDKAGRVMREVESKDNRPNGPMKTYDEQGKLVTESQYRAGKLDGVMKYFYPSGVEEMEGQWKGGQPQGAFKYFDEQGRLEKTIESKGSQATDKNFRDQPTEKNYFPSGHIKSEVSYGTATMTYSFYKEYDEAGKVLLDARVKAAFKDCWLDVPKKEFAANEEVGLEVRCTCEGSPDCFVPNECANLNRRKDFEAVRVEDTTGHRYRIMRVLLFAGPGVESSFTFKSGEAACRFPLPQFPYNKSEDTEYFLVEEHSIEKFKATAGGMDLSRCELGGSDCDGGVFKRFPSGKYTAWLEGGKKAEPVGFEIK